MKPYLPGYKLVVLDDDPTGVQTVHDVSVYTDWSLESIQSGFEEPEPLFFLLTNSRSFTEEQTRRAHTEIAERVFQISRKTGIPYVIVSRSDSTLRGHFPLETQVLRDTLEELGEPPFDGEVLCPFFLEGGRVTIENIHYVKEKGGLIPASETEFARDKTFGYHFSDLRRYVEEKTGGKYPASSVACISLDLLRSKSVEEIEKILLSASGFGKIVVNAEEYSDLHPFCEALASAVRRGKRYILRSAASLVKVLGGVPDRHLLSGEELRGGELGGGLVVAGSYTEKTTSQLKRLLTLPGTEAVALHSELVLEEGEGFAAECRRARRACEEIMSRGHTAVVYTDRRPLVREGDTPESSLLRSVRISEGLQSIVKELTRAPAFLVVKGGITSSYIAVKALGVRKARVLGQLRPGIPVWRIGGESRFPGVPYVIFPGNVGEEDTLKEVVEAFGVSEGRVCG